jgi:hypothetical protein
METRGKRRCRLVPLPKDGCNQLEISAQCRLSDRNSMSEKLILWILHLPTISIKCMKTLRYECLSYAQKLDFDTRECNSSGLIGMEYFRRSFQPGEYLRPKICR